MPATAYLVILGVALVGLAVAFIDYLHVCRKDDRERAERLALFDEGAR